jgi:hypothetical protein
VIASAERFADLIDLHNALSHEYPNDPQRQARAVNAAYGAIDDLLGTLDRLEAFVAGQPATKAPAPRRQSGGEGS